MQPTNNYWEWKLGDNQFDEKKWKIKDKKIEKINRIIQLLSSKQAFVMVDGWFFYGHFPQLSQQEKHKIETNFTNKKIISCYSN